VVSADPRVIEAYTGVAEAEPVRPGQAVGA
jgi:hypothetical protein